MNVWKENAALWLKTAVLLLSFGLALTGMTRTGPTFDEQGFLVRGVGYVRGDNRHMRVGHPAGLNILNALLIAPDEQITLPVDDPSWQTTEFHRPAELFLWEIGNNVERVMVLGRLPTVWLGLLLLALVWRWAWALTRSQNAALLALGVLAFDPNFLAHTGLATTDLGLTAASLLAGFGMWRYWKRPSLLRVLFAGVAFGLLANTKFTAGLFVPLFGLVAIVGAAARWRKEGEGFPRTAVLLFLIIFPLTAIVTLWAAYGFDIGALPDNLPSLPQLAGKTVPLRHYLDQLLDIGGRLQKSTPAFLLGNYSDHGWTYYFPVAFLLKTPLPTLILLVWAFILSIRQRLKNSQLKIHYSLFDTAALLIPPLGYFAIALTSEINLGYRHLLPTLPFLYIFAATTIYNDVKARPRFTIHNSQFTIHYLFFLLIIALSIHPHYLAYFNLLAGGPNNGWRALVDSNIDWGQDLGALKGWMDENEVDHVYLGYFGEARPEYYGINYTGLDSWPPRLMNPETRPFYPTNPAPGHYAISATALQGVHFDDHDRFAFFRDRDPIAKIGYSIFIYEVEPYGKPVDLLLSGIQIDEIVPEDYALLGTNDVTPHWLDPSQSWLVTSENVWMAFDPDTVIHPYIERYTEYLHIESESLPYILYSDPSVLKTMGAGITFTLGESGIISLSKAWNPVFDTLSDTIILQTSWIYAYSSQLPLFEEVPPQPVKIFVHLTNSDGELIAQWDGLGVAWEGWRDRNLLLQIHTIPIPPDTPPGTYQLWTGLYDPHTGERWQIDETLSNSRAIADVKIDDGRYFIGEVELP